MQTSGEEETMFEAEGGCSCGAVRYRVKATPYHLTHCHCTQCRRASAAPFVTWFSVRSEGFVVLKGGLARHRSSPMAVRSFCARCGTQLTFQRDDRASEVDVTMCSLDDPAALTPEDHTYTRSRLPWVRTGDGLPEHVTTRESG
jgi:hypothetical protein